VAKLPSERDEPPVRPARRHAGESRCVYVGRF
jgi:hypothetical protein